MRQEALAFILQSEIIPRYEPKLDSFPVLCSRPGMEERTDMFPQPAHHELRSAGVSVLPLCDVHPVLGTLLPTLCPLLPTAALHQNTSHMSLYKQKEE